jgi:predicted dehydrogenase
MTDRLRMIVVGVGRGRAHLRSFLALPDAFEVAGLVDLDEERLENALGEHELSPDLGYTSYDEALARSGCDGVMVATWARSHAALIEQALNAGKHVLVEKPFTIELADACRLLEMAEAKELKIVVIQQWRFLPGQRTVRRLMSSLEYGQPQEGHLLCYKARGSEYPDSPHSQLWQMTVHEIDSLISMMNQPVVEVYGHSFRPPETTWKRESTATAELRFRNGCRVVMVSTSDARIGSCEFRAECERAALVYRISAPFGGEESLFVGENRESGLLPVAIDEGPRESRFLDRRIAAGFGDWVQGGPEPETSGRNNLQVLGVLDALMRSGVSGRAIEVEV